MRREETFVQSHRPYAIDLASLRTDEHGLSEMTAVWFRRRRGLTVACIGRLWDFQRPRPADAAQFLKQHDDGRYGGDCTGRWDGSRYWGQQEPELAAADLNLLRPMLANFPAIPPGFDGWWTFR